MTTPYLSGDITAFEGCKLTAYPDPISHGAPWTIGVGHTGREVHPGLTWTQGQAGNALAADIAATCHGLDSALPWWRTLGDPRQDALVNLAFNLGVHGLLGFNTFLALMQKQTFALAADDLSQTRWAKQVGHRATWLADLIRTGIRKVPT